MTLIIRASGTGVDFSQNALGGVLTSLRSGLIGEYLFGGNLTESRKNWANAAQPLTDIGSPTIGSNYADLGATGFSTGLFESENITMIAIGYGTASNFASFVTNFNGSNGGQSSGIFVHASTDLLYCQAHSTDGTNQNITLALAQPDADYRFVAGRISSGTNYAQKLDQFKAGAHTFNHQTIAKTRVGNTVHPLKISAGFTEPVRMAGALIYNRVLSDAELLQVYNEVRGAMSLRNIAT